MPYTVIKYNQFTIIIIYKQFYHFWKLGKKACNWIDDSCLWSWSDWLSLSKLSWTLGRILPADTAHPSLFTFCAADEQSSGSRSIDTGDKKKICVQMGIDVIDDFRLLLILCVTQICQMFVNNPPLTCSSNLAISKDTQSSGRWLAILMKQHQKHQCWSSYFGPFGIGVAAMTVARSIKIWSALEKGAVTLENFNRS